MTSAQALDPQAAAAIAAAVQTAYGQAVAGQWAAPARAALWDATVEAVVAYLQAPADPAARRYHHLLVDLSADVTAEQIAAWPGPVQRAARLAATHALRQPSRPAHRPRAQALLKRLDLVQSPLLQARERLLLAVARQRQALGQERGTGPLTGPRKHPEAVAEAGLMILRRITEAARGMALPDPADPAADSAVARLRELQGLVESGQYLDASRQPAVFEAIQRLMAPDRADLPLLPALDALEAVRLQANPAVRAGRAALAAMVFELRLGAYSPEDAPALARHLADLAHVARNLGDIPAAQLGPILFRLRQRLSDPASEAIEARIDEALAVLARLEARREGALARLARVEAAIMHPDDQRHEVSAARARLREVEQLIDAVHQVGLARLAPAEAAGLARTYARLEELAAAHGHDAEGFAQALQDLVLQLERPALAANRLWQAARTALRQVVAQRRALEDQGRGLALDRHLDDRARLARQADLARRVALLDQARTVLGALRFEKVHPDAEPDALAALNGFNHAVRLAVAGGDPGPLRSALDLLVTIGGRAA